MKCISHNHIDAVGQCITCWGWLCKECMSNFTISICPNCNLMNWENRKKEILSLRKKVPLYGIGIGFLITMLESSSRYNMDDTTYLILWSFYSILWIFIYFWWIWINNLKSKQNSDTITIRVNDNFMAMVIRVSFKIVFAWMIWIFVWPYEIYKLRKEYKEALRMIDICKTTISKNTHS